MLGQLVLCLYVCPYQSTPTGRKLRLIMATFANILYDEAFKVVLTEPSNRQLLIKLIEFFVPEKTISALTLNDKEQHGLILSDKNVNFDLYCTTDQGESFIVEMQFSSQESFRDRALYYATYPIRSQVVERLKAIRDLDQKGTRRMDYSLSPVYVISILNFKMNHAFHLFGTGTPAMETG